MKRTFATLGLLIAAPAGLHVGFFLLRQQIAISLDGRPGTQFAVPAGVAVYSRRADLAGLGRRGHRMADNPAAVAHELFAVLRTLDADGCTEIWVEQPPGGPAWEGVADRLRRAASPFQFARMES